jgi:hypothetical protein
LNKADEIENLLRGVGVRSSTPRTSHGVGTDVTPEKSVRAEDDTPEPAQSQSEFETISQLPP